MKKIYLLIILSSLLVIAGCGSGNKDTNNIVQDNNINKVSGNAYNIEIKSDGFLPSELKIKSGDKVTWVNKDIKDSWLATAVHPTHEKYPGSNIEKCGTAEETKIFDSCRGLKQNEQWSFTFTEKGEWEYHDHLNFPGNYGKIIVE